MGSSASSRQQSKPASLTGSRVSVKAQAVSAPVTPVIQGASWKHLLTTTASMNLWAEKREDRPRWAQYMRQAQELTAIDRTPMNKETIQAVLSGDLTSALVNDMATLGNKIIIFVSSTFTDTAAERNALMRDVYPYLRSLCRLLELDFGVVDMRWGVSEETSLEHGTLAMCLSQVDRSIADSTGPAFLALLADKYGYRMSPPLIEQNEFEAIEKALAAAGESTDLLRQYFQLNTNVQPAQYTLKPRETGNEVYQRDEETIRDMLRRGANIALAGSAAAAKYFVSVTEQEVQRGIIDNEKRVGQTLVLERGLSNVCEPVHADRHLVDMLVDMNGKPVIDSEARQLLEELKTNKVGQSLPATNVIHMQYIDNNEKACGQYVQNVCDSICEWLTQAILSEYAKKFRTVIEPVVAEVLQHRATVKSKSGQFVGRQQQLSSIREYLQSSRTFPLVVYGESGTGKTALMAAATQLVTHSTTRHSVLIFRFIGTTTFSGSARALLYSICEQLQRAYGNETSTIPKDYKELISYFATSLSLASADKPLVLVLDSLDQLSNEDMGSDLKWLSLKQQLPAHVHLVLSTLPGPCLDVLRSHVPAEHMVQVEPLAQADSTAMLSSMLDANKRTLTEQQWSIVQAACQLCPLPLYIKLTTDIAIRWHSYDAIHPDILADNLTGLIETIFSRLEHRYGNVFVHHALAYITAAKEGLSVTELEDILSCDDDVLDAVFVYWVPPFRRIPPLLWLRVRSELGDYLVERGVDGVNVYAWYHRQFWQTATSRYLQHSPQQSTQPFLPQALSAIADYFEGRWSKGKPYVPKTASNKSQTQSQPGIEDRQVSEQPIVISDSLTTGGGRLLNKRKLRELPTALIGLSAWERLENIVCQLDFLEAKFAAEQGFDALTELNEAAQLCRRPTVKAVAKFIGSNLANLLHESAAIYQLASQQVPDHFLKKQFVQRDPHQLPLRIIADSQPEQNEDPCEMTLRGHTSGVRCCQYSPKGDLIASTGEDGALRVWHAGSGAELVTVAPLPGPTYPNLADPYHGERPCAFSPDGNLIATGSEDGFIQVWDTTGAQIFSEQRADDEAVTGVVFLPSVAMLLTCGKAGIVCWWQTSGWQCVGTTRVSGQPLGLNVSASGNTVGVATGGNQPGLTLIDTRTQSIISANRGMSGMNFSVSFSPVDENLAATGGNDSCVTLWRNGSANGRLTGHKGWIWNVCFTPDGSKLLSCSSDRSLKVWQVSGQQCLVTLGGHLHRISWVSVRAGAEVFVTGSLDCSLKVWNMMAVCEGRIPAVCGLHFTSLAVSADSRYMASSQGWASSATITSLSTHSDVGKSGTHNGFVDKAVFSADSSKLITIDTGHGGSYESGAERNASVFVTTLADFSSRRLAVYCPQAVACNSLFIAIGTTDLKLHLFSSETSESVKMWSWTDEAPDAGIVSVSLAQTLLAAAAGNTVRVFDISNPSDDKVACVKNIACSDHVKLCRFSSDGVHLATSTVDGAVTIWLVSTYNKLHSLTSHRSMLRCMTYSPNGHLLLTVSVDMSVRLWSVNDQYKALATWYGPVNYAAFVSDETFIVGEATGNKRLLLIPA